MPGVDVKNVKCFSLQFFCLAMLFDKNCLDLKNKEIFCGNSTGGGLVTNEFWQLLLCRYFYSTSSVIRCPYFIWSDLCKYLAIRKRKGCWKSYPLSSIASSINRYNFHSLSADAYHLQLHSNHGLDIRTIHLYIKFKKSTMFW